MKKIKSIEGVKFGKSIEPGNASKRYEITIQPEDYQTSLRFHKNSTALPDTEKIQKLQQATFSNSILGQHAGIITRGLPQNNNPDGLLAATIAQIEIE